EERGRVVRAGADLRVVRRNDEAAAVGPEARQREDDLLERHAPVLPQPRQRETTGSAGRRLGADVVDALHAGGGAAAVAGRVAVVARLRAALVRRVAHPHVAEAAAALGAARAGVAVGLARVERPEAAHREVGLVLSGEMERGMARVLPGRRVLVDRGD